MAVKKTSISLSLKMANDVDKHWQEFGYNDRTDFITIAIALQMERDRLQREERLQQKEQQTEK